MLTENFQKASTLIILLGLLINSSCKDKSSFDYIANTDIIPAPSELVVGDGYFEIPRDLMIIDAPTAFSNATDLLHSYLGGLGFVDYAKTRPEETSAFIFKLDDSVKNEGYVLDISEENIIISASSASGAFYAVQSLRQLFPPTLENKKNLVIENIKIPTLTIKDEPRFSYRGMHLDVSRHFYDKEFIKEYISHLAMLKMNTFHWHLTDDQGWRIEIKQYPNLTKHGAFRDETLIGHYNESPQQFDGKRYGGFYTQEDIKEVVAFATALNVTVIPEIELPGHAQAAISAYPELGCTGEQVPVATKWGVFENIYCPKPETFTFLKNVLGEVMELFPSEYIHIGGDEAPKTQWKSCGHCQKLIKEKELKDEHGLQSHFIKEMETFVNSKGKKIIGWDEILEGGLAPNATVMSWRGTKGAVDAAKEGHDVILTPTSHAYFDYYQATHEDEPTAIGGFLPLKKVFSFNPIPKELTAQEAKYVLGAQGNVWTEYMPTENQVEYMAFPRMLAMSEVVWNGAVKDIETEYPKFLKKVEAFMPRMDHLNINYANHLYDVFGNIKKQNDSIFYTLETLIDGKDIMYRTNLSEEKKYEGPIYISENTELTARVPLENGKKGRVFTDTIHYHKGINAQVSLNVEPHAAYSAGGKEALINGVSGSNTRFGDKEWLGFWGDDLEITITFPEPTKITKISTRFYNANGQWLYVPKEISGNVIMQDGGTLSNKKEILETDNSIVSISIGFSGPIDIITQKITLIIPNYGTIPDGLQGAGNKAWTFIDEIVIE